MSLNHYTGVQTKTHHCIRHSSSNSPLHNSQSNNHYAATILDTTSLDSEDSMDAPLHIDEWLQLRLFMQTSNTPVALAVYPTRQHWYMQPYLIDSSVQDGVACKQTHQKRS